MHPVRPLSQQRGLSIIEFMVGIAVGLLIVGGATKLFVDNLVNNRRLLLETRINQDLRAAADVVVRDLRRAGYWKNATSGVWGTGSVSVVANPHAAASAPTTSSVTYSYERDTTGNVADALDSNEYAGFQLGTAANGKGVVLVQNGQNNLQQLTDPGTVDIQEFTVTPTTIDRDLSSYCGCLKTLTCTLTSIAATGTPPKLSIREFAFVLRGRSLNYGSDKIERTIRETVRVRNEQLSGTCPA